MDRKNCKPAISVCVPVYNAAEYLREGIDSILAQIFVDFELLMVDDGSTDNSCEIIESYPDERIRLVKNKHNFICTLNTLFSEARGKYIAWLDSDDRMKTHRLQVQYDYMERFPNVDVLGGGIQIFGKSSGRYVPEITGRYISVNEMLKQNLIANPTTMIRRSSLLKSRLKIEQDYHCAHDYHLWMRMLQQGMRIENIPDIVTEYRSSDSQISTARQFQQATEAESIREEIRRNSSLQEKEEATKAPPIIDRGKKITLIIPFLNEGIEVARTVASSKGFNGFFCYNDCKNPPTVTTAGATTSTATGTGTEGANSSFGLGSSMLF